MSYDNWDKIYIDISGYNPVQDILIWFHKRKLHGHKHWYWDIKESEFLDNKLCLRIHPDLIDEIFMVRVKWGS